MRKHGDSERCDGMESPVQSALKGHKKAHPKPAHGQQSKYNWEMWKGLDRQLPFSLCHGKECC